MSNIFSNKIITKLNKNLEKLETELKLVETQIHNVEDSRNSILSQIETLKDSVISQIINDQKLIHNNITDKNLLLEKRYNNIELLSQLKKFESIVLNNSIYEFSDFSQFVEYIQRQTQNYNKFINEYPSLKKISYSKNFSTINLELPNIIKNTKIINSGYKAEQDTLKVIKTFSDQAKYLTNNRISITDEQSNEIITADNDIIIICKNGVFLLEVKNSSSDLKIDENGNLISKNGYTSLDIVQKCLKHNNIVRRTLNDELKKLKINNLNVNIYSMIITANNMINVHDKNNRIPILLKNEIQDYIFNECKCDSPLSEDTIQLFFDILESNDIGLAKFKTEINDINLLINELSLFIAIDNNYEKYCKLFKNNIFKTLSQLDSDKEAYLKSRNNIKTNIKATKEQIDNIQKNQSLLLDALNILRNDKLTKLASISCIVIVLLSIAFNSFTKFSYQAALDKNEELYSSMTYVDKSPEQQNKDLSNDLAKLESENEKLKLSLDGLDSQTSSFNLQHGTTWSGTVEYEENSGEKVSAPIKLNYDDQNIVLSIGDGSYNLMKYMIDEETGFVALKSGEWIVPINDLNTLDLHGAVNGDQFNGFLTEKNDSSIFGTFTMKKSN